MHYSKQEMFYSDVQHLQSQDINHRKCSDLSSVNQVLLIGDPYASALQSEKG